MCERLAVEALEPRYRREHIVAQPRPVEAAVGHVPAELAGVVNILREMGAIDEQLLGHAATDDAGAADAMFLRHRDARAVRGSDTARSEEHTSELQSLMRISYAVFCLKKKTNTQ